MELLLISFVSATSVMALAQDNVVGCYSVSVAKPDEPPSQLKQEKRLVRQKDIRLTSKNAITPWSTNRAFQVEPLISSDKFNYAAAYWTWEKGELSIIWSNTGLSGVQMSLTPATNGFEGTIENFWDFEPFATDQRRATLTRRSCEINL